MSICSTTGSRLVDPAAVGCGRDAGTGTSVTMPILPCQCCTSSRDRGPDAAGTFGGSGNCFQASDAIDLDAANLLVGRRSGRGDRCRALIADRADVYKSPVPPLGGVPEVRPERTEQMAANPVLPPAESGNSRAAILPRRATAPTGDPAASSTGGAARGIPDAAFKAAPPIGPTGDKPAPSIGASRKRDPRTGPPRRHPPIGPPGRQYRPVDWCNRKRDCCSDGGCRCGKSSGAAQ